VKLQNQPQMYHLLFNPQNFRDFFYYKIEKRSENFLFSIKIRTFAADFSNYTT